MTDSEKRIATEQQRWDDAFRSTTESIYRMASDYVKAQDALNKIASFPGTTLGPPIVPGSERDTEENRAFQRGLNMAFHRCAEIARAGARVTPPSPAEAAK